MLTNPPTVRVRPPGLIDISDMADALNHDSREWRTTYDALRQLMLANYLIPTCREGGGRKVFLFTPDTFMLADVLLRAREFGIRGSADDKSDPFAAASLALRHWSGGKPDWTSERTPAAHVIVDYTSGREGWVFELHSFAHYKRDRIHFEGRIHNVGANLATHLRHGESNDWQHRGCFAVDLTDAMARWHPEAKKRRDAMT